MDFVNRTKLLIDDKKLAAGTVLIFGLGGVGSFTAEALVRMGVGHIIVCDNDIVNVSNINRQLLALHSTVGRLKVDVARERFLDIDPELDICTYSTFILPENAGDFFDGLLRKPDFVADCIDTVSGKLAIISECKNRNIPVISCMGTGNKLHPEEFRIADIKKTSVCPLCRVMRRELKNRGIEELKVLYSTEVPVKTAEDISEENSEKNIYINSDINSSINSSINSDHNMCEYVNGYADGHADRHADGHADGHAEGYVFKNSCSNKNGRVIGSIATVPSVAGLLIANYIAGELVK